jgi:hypothetical protein
MQIRRAAVSGEVGVAARDQRRQVLVAGARTAEKRHKVTASLSADAEPLRRLTLTKPTLLAQHRKKCVDSFLSFHFSISNDERRHIKVLMTPTLGWRARASVVLHLIKFYSSLYCWAALHTGNSALLQIPGCNKQCGCCTNENARFYSMS